MFVGATHCVFGAFVFFEPLSGILRDGLWNAVSGYPGRPLAFWFELLGILMVLFGATIDQLEKNQQAIPRYIAVGFAFLTALAIVAIPASGGWLMLPSAVGLFLEKADVPGQNGR